MRGAQATLRAARRRLYLQYGATGGRQASRERMEVGVDEMVLVTDLCTLCHRVFIALRERERGPQRSAK